MLRSLGFAVLGVVQLCLLAMVSLDAMDVDVDVRWWMWLVVVGAAAFLGRSLVELAWPARSGTPARSMTLGRPWKVLGALWVILAAVLLIALAVASVARIHVG